MEQDEIDGEGEDGDGEDSEDEEGEELGKKRKHAKISPIPKVPANRSTKKFVSPAVDPNDQAPEERKNFGRFIIDCARCTESHNIARSPHSSTSL